MQFHDICNHLGLIASSLPPINDSNTINEYKEILLHGLESFDDITYIEIGMMLIDSWAKIQHVLLARANNQQFDGDFDRKAAQDFITNLKSQKQTAQRTAAWYEQGKRILTASEIYSLFRAPRARAQMVFSKVEVTYRTSQNHAVTSDRMTAFDWGIRFEPVVKQIFEFGLRSFASYQTAPSCSPTSEFRHQCVIEELGRIMHPTDPRVAASPDGLITEGPDHLLGQLIEIKAPVTREIGLGIPDEYYAQIQTQLEVTGAKACQYIEMKFNSPYNTSGDPTKVTPQPTGPPLYYGYIYLIKTPPQHTEDNIFAEDTLSYVYGSVNSEEQPEIDSKSTVVEVIPWKCMGWSLHVVPRRPDWWASIQPAIDKFWEDVEGARNGTFVMPASTRQKKGVSNTDPQATVSHSEEYTPKSPAPQTE